LAGKLGVQASAAKAYLQQFKSVGILDEEGKPTNLVNEWRNDETYTSAITKILEQVYPSDLVGSQPPGDANAGEIRNYFELEGLGSGTAGNKAATYVLIANSQPGDQQELSKNSPSNSTKTKKRTKKVQPPVDRKDGPPTSHSKTKEGSFVPELNVNLQIHISADATNEQIETIFASMGRFLRS
jgi:hypothetical protein